MAYASKPEKAPEEPVASQPDSEFEDGYIVDEKGVVSVVKTRSGYAPVPPQGYRLANEAEIEAFKASQGQGLEDELAPKGFPPLGPAQSDEGEV